MYAKKNSITLAIFLIVFISVGIFMTKNGTKELLALKSEAVQLEHRYNQYASVASKVHELELRRHYLNYLWENAPKVLIAADEPAFSYLYFNKIISQRNMSLDFNFIMEDKVEKKMFTSYLYKLEGEGSFSDVYKLLFYLAETPILYQIQSFDFKNADPNSDLIQFVVKLQSFSMKKEWMIGNEGKMTEDFEVPNASFVLNHNTFKPLVRMVEARRPAPSRFRPRGRPVAPKKKEEPDLPDIRKSILQAAMADKILIKDQSNRILTLSLGDKVKGGYLSTIDLRRSEAEFLMANQEVVTLGLGYVREGGKLRSSISTEKQTIVH